ncbi:MAG: aldo/keto reductase, partial [Dehalococcoidales bacterium]
MKYRKLGKQAIEVGVIGLGAEYLEKASRETITSVLDVAMEAGVNYTDLFMASPDVRDHFGAALAGRRERMMIAGHLGATMKDGQYFRSRDSDHSERYVDDLLTRLRSDYIDVLMLHFVDDDGDFDRVFDDGGLLALAKRLQKAGKARILGISSHVAPVSLRAVRSGEIDVLMFPVNPALDTLPGNLKIEAQWEDDIFGEVATDKAGLASDRQELYHACAAAGVAVVAMKPYYAGRLFVAGNASGMVLTPVQCLAYTLDRPGVATAVPGCRTADEMRAALAYLDAGEEERDYSSIHENPVWKLRGSCTYCNHCLPCPEGIDIGGVTRLADIAGYQADETVITDYEA